MANKPIYTNLDFKQIAALVQTMFEKLAADPASPVDAQEWYDSTNHVRKIRANGQTETYAFQSWVLQQINALGQLQGGFSAAAGSLPEASDKTTGDTSAIKVGDAWVITAAGTITGIQGADELSEGDKLQFLSGDPTVAANWVGIQRNLDDALLGNVVTDRQTNNLVANTALTVSSSVVSDIHSVQVYDSAGKQIEVCIEKTANPNQSVLTSVANLTGITIELTGSGN